jgi:hypothetical protein
MEYGTKEETGRIGGALEKGEATVMHLPNSSARSIDKIAEPENTDPFPVLRRFERAGLQELKRMIEVDREQARIWVSSILPALEALETALTLRPESGDVREGLVARAAQDSGGTENGSAETPRAEALFGKLRSGLIAELAILEFVAQETRAVPINAISDMLCSKGLSTPRRRSALVTKLNRMKARGYLSWTSVGRSPDIKVTDVGSGYVRDLRLRQLYKKEIDFLAE